MDKKALLDELKIDRDAPRRASRPLKILIPLGIVGGLAVVAWAFGVPYLQRGTLIEVETASARVGVDAEPGASVLDATGYVVARRQATVSSKATGKVLEVLVEEGMRVEEGQLLATLDASLQRAQLALEESQLAAAEIALEEIETSIAQAELDLERTRNLAERELASQAELDRNRIALEGLEARLKYAQRQLEIARRGVDVQRLLVEDMEIRAPFAGVVIAKAAQPGEMISPVSAGGGFTRTGICTIVDMGSLEVEVDVNEAYINRVRPGQPVTATLNAYPDLDLPAEVIATIPAADRSKATVRVRIGFKSRDSRVVPDMGVRVAFLEEETDRAKAVRAVPGVEIPRTAVVGSADDRHVWVVVTDPADGASFLERRSVVAARPEGSRVRVTDGLRDGERVVRSFGAVLEGELRDGLHVRVAN
ncbi:MAG: efflux RND transporter periplasmic adaptor subunit [Gammaproteobacteria bacterium]|nr:efflux RND transporter periplasmic adaptor subunit [Gammaproteobacteria bacterium]MYF29034.1 efflux RND transporter periplasmic adaptor subunit [Gammaproteobacteria bacterium]MYK45835.1 efflux RND transporter periplasmic adaptor subunit [Gammaproteobacteria bacterium]